jgi:hypothetical protein
VEGRRLGKSGCTDALCTPCEQDLAEFCNLGVADLQIWKAGAGREACKGCVASAVMGTSNFAGKRCSSLELWALCAKQEKAERELAISCAGQMKHSCGRHFFIGAKCAECVKLHSARMDFGLIDKSQCTKMHMDHACFDKTVRLFPTNETKGGAHPPAHTAPAGAVADIAKIASSADQEIKTCDDEVKKYCGPEFNDINVWKRLEKIDGASVDEVETTRCLKCIKDHMRRIDKGLESVCSLSDLSIMCDGEMKQKAEPEQLACERQVMNSCWSTEGEACATCMKAHLDEHRKEPRKCSEFQLANFCFFFSWGKSKSSLPPKQRGIAASNTTTARSPPNPGATAPAQVGLSTDATNFTGVANKADAFITCDDEVKTYCAPEATHGMWAPDQAITGGIVEKCVSCIQDHMKRIDNGLDSICSLSDLSMMCDGEMKPKTFAEKLGCEKQIMESCWNTEGSSCFTCMKDHAAEHRKEPRKCSEFQLANFCAFYSWGKAKSARNKPVSHHIPQIPPGEIAKEKVSPTSSQVAVPKADVIASTCEGEVKQFCGPIDFSKTENEQTCLACVKQHIKRLKATPSMRALSLCALYDLAQMCDVQMRDKPKEQAVACEKQVEIRCKDQVGDSSCKRCVKMHVQEIESGQRPDNTCTLFQLKHFCYFYQYLDIGSLSPLSGPKILELATSPGPSVEKHLSVIPTAAPTVVEQAHIPVGRPKNPPPLVTFIRDGSQPSSCEEEVKQYCPTLVASKVNSRECLDCVKVHIERITAALKPANGIFDAVPLCSLRELGVMCNVSMRGQSNEETLSCEHELKRFCGHQELEGPECIQCVKNRLEKIDGGLIGDGMCSEYQINHFCFAYNSETKEDAGIEKLKAENAASAVNVKRVIKGFDTCDAELMHHCSGISSPFGTHIISS